MSVSNSSGVGGAPITFSGISTGLDTSSIIQQLLAIDRAPITTLTNQETAIQTKQTALGQLQALVTTLGGDMSALSRTSAFSTTTGTSSNTAAATLSSGASSAAGVYNLTVTQLATAGKIASSAQQDPTAALNLTGSFVLNGHTINVGSTDSVTTIAQSINTANAGVTASLINGGAGNVYLTLTSNSTGAANAVQINDMSGTVAQTLGLVTSTSAIRQPITNGAQGAVFSSQTAPVGGLLGATTSPAGTFTINGVSVSADFSTDSLQTIASNINAASTGATATVQQVTNNGKTGYQLVITGSSGTPTFTDPNGLLGDLGVLQNNYGDTLVGAQDAKYSLDKVNLSSASNTITSAIPGATLTLMSGTPTSPTTSTLSISTDTSGISQQLSGFASDYNAVVNFISQESALDTSTFVSGPLFGDFTTEQVQSNLASSLFTSVPGLSGAINNLSALGFSLDKNDNLQINQTTLSTALATNPSAVANVFAATGSTTSTSLGYVTSTTKTVSNGNPYLVNIAQVATKGSYTAEQAQTSANSTNETLTFNGALFGSTPYSLILNSGNDLNATINQINADPTLSKFVVASNNGGSLQISSLQYGTPGNFAVVSNQQASASNSGIGVGSLGTTVTGLDVAGTINGETATGSGQYLTGASGNATTDGLEVRYSGATTGNVGTVTYTNGIANQMNNVILSLTNATSGTFTSASNAMTQQVTDINAQITAIQAQVAVEQTQLQNEFANMEAAISSLKNQESSLSSIMGSLAANSSSSSSSSSSH